MLWGSDETAAGFLGMVECSLKLYNGLVEGSNEMNHTNSRLIQRHSLHKHFPGFCTTFLLPENNESDQLKDCASSQITSAVHYCLSCFSEFAALKATTSLQLHLTPHIASRPTNFEPLVFNPRDQLSKLLPNLPTIAETCKRLNLEEDHERKPIFKKLRGGDGSVTFQRTKVSAQEAKIRSYQLPKLFLDQHPLI